MWCAWGQRGEREESFPNFLLNSWYEIYHILKIVNFSRGGGVLGGSAGKREESFPNFLLNSWCEIYHILTIVDFSRGGNLWGVGVCGWGLGPEIQAGRKTMNVERRPGGAYEILPGGARGPLVWRNRGGRRELTAHGRVTLGNFQDILLWVPVYE